MSRFHPASHITTVFCVCLCLSIGQPSIAFSALSSSFYCPFLFLFSLFGTVTCQYLSCLTRWCYCSFDRWSFYTTVVVYLVLTWLSNSKERGRFPNSLIMSSVTLFKENKLSSSSLDLFSVPVLCGRSNIQYVLKQAGNNRIYLLTAFLLFKQFSSVYSWCYGFGLCSGKTETKLLALIYQILYT